MQARMKLWTCPGSHEKEGVHITFNHLKKLGDTRDDSFGTLNPFCRTHRCLRINYDPYETVGTARVDR